MIPRNSDTQTTQPEAPKARCAVADGSAPTYEEIGGHVRRAFVIYEEPGKIPQKKGPFVRESEVEKVLREMKPHHHPDTRYTVAEITFDFDLWLTTASEFLTLQELAMSHGAGEPRPKL